MSQKYLGVTDQPRISGEEDLLSLDAYATGLCEFIKVCQTPMSIALQGDWGSGKSSLLNYIETKMNARGVKTVVINTWQYSQMRQEDKLAKIFIASLLNSMDLGTKEALKRAVGEAALQFGRIAVRAVGGSEDALDELTKCETDIKNITMLRNNFQEAVSVAVKNHAANQSNDSPVCDDRMVILVDDLDRLNPNVAVELLEIIKLFMDVKMCIFVLAIDYEVVVQGVRSKFGESMPEEKCRSFFDKIVQLPFHMPVERYKLNKMIQSYLGDKLKGKYIDNISEFAEVVIGANPRALKRLVNSFLLIGIIQNEINKTSSTVHAAYTEEEYALLFCILCIQIRHSTLFRYLSDTETWLEAIKDKEYMWTLPEDEGYDTAKENLCQSLSSYEEGMDSHQLDVMINILRLLDSILEVTYEKEKEKYEHLSRIIQLSAVTSRETTSERPKRTSRSTPVTIVINGEETDFSVAHEAFKMAAEIMMAKCPDKIALCLDKPLTFLTTDPDRKQGVFDADGRKKRKLNGIFHDGKPVYIGIHSNTETKKSQLTSLRIQLGFSEGFLIWKDTKGSFVL